MARATQPPKKREQDLLFPPLIPAPVPMIRTLPPSGVAGALPGMESVRALPPGVYEMGGPRAFNMGAPAPAPVQSLPSGAPQALLEAPGPRVFNMGGPQPTAPTMLGPGEAPRLLNPGQPAPQRVFNMGGPQPTPRGALGPGAAPRMLPSGAAPSGSGGAATAGGAAAGGASAGGAAVALKSGAASALRALPWLAAVGGAATYDALGRQDVRTAFADENSGLRKAMTAAAEESKAYKARGDRPGEIGAEIRNAATVGWEGLKAYAYPTRTAAFLSGLFGAGDEAPAAVAPAAAIPATAPTAAAPVRQSPQGPTLSLAQLLPLMEAMPRQAAGRVPTGKEAMYQRLDDLFAMRQQAILESPLPAEQKSRLLDKLQAELTASLSGQLMPFDDNME